MHKRKNTSIVVILLSLISLGCNSNNNFVNGSSSETVIGKIINNDGSSACSTVVTLYPDDFDPVKDVAHHKPFSDTTDENGFYFIRIPKDSLSYSILAAKINTGTRALVKNIHAIEDTTIVPDAMLKNPGTITVSLPAGINKNNGYMYVPGTGLHAFFVPGSNTVTLDSVPAGLIAEVCFSFKDDSLLSMSRYSVIVESDDTTDINHPQWNYEKRLYLNTTTDGASIQGNVYDFPVLIRLTELNFEFDQANPDGSDICFTGEDNGFLPFEIERWDPEEKSAEIWVTVDTILGNNNTQHLTMYWGNPGIHNSTVSLPVFDTAKGFQGVWHLAETGNTTVLDATQNSYDGTLSGMSSISSVTGIIGKAKDFDGDGSYIIMRNTANSKLNFPENGNYSVSLWANADLIDTIWHGIVSKGHRQYYLQYKCFRDTAASWEFVEYKNRGGWEYSEYIKTPAPGIQQWVYLTGVREGNRQYLYVNGELVKDTAYLNPTSEERNEKCDFTVGCHLNHDSLPEIHGWSYFNGKIDEIRIMSKVPGSDWIRLCYMNQKENDALVEFR